ncbi:MAG: hypothetical protein Q9227_006821 [Pyrenula ochraceoflavens]
MHIFSLQTLLYISGALAVPWGPPGHPPVNAQRDTVARTPGPGGNSGACKSVQPDNPSLNHGVVINNKSGSSQTYYFLQNSANGCDKSGADSAMGFTSQMCVTVPAGQGGFVAVDASFKGKVVQGPATDPGSFDVAGGNDWGYGTFAELQMDSSSCGGNGTGGDVSMNAGYDTSIVFYNMDPDVQGMGTMDSVSYSYPQTAGFTENLWELCPDMTGTPRPGSNTKVVMADQVASCAEKQLSKHTNKGGTVAYWGGKGDGAMWINSKTAFKVGIDFYSWSQSGEPS